MYDSAESAPATALMVHSQCKYLCRVCCAVGKRQTVYKVAPVASESWRVLAQISLGLPGPPWASLGLLGPPRAGQKRDKKRM